MCLHRKSISGSALPLVCTRLHACVGYPVVRILREVWAHEHRQALNAQLCSNVWIFNHVHSWSMLTSDLSSSRHTLRSEFASIDGWISGVTGRSFCLCIVLSRMRSSFMYMFFDV